MTLLRLFAVRNTQSSKPEPTFYGDKPTARAARDNLNAGSTQAHYVVTRGPDHRHYRLQ